MRALVYTEPRSLTYRDEPAPRLPDGECLVRVEAVGICGSDMHAFLGHDERRPAPLILGHEAAGVVVEGPGTGTRVTVNPLATCGQCRACKAGRNNLCPERQKTWSRSPTASPSRRPAWPNRWPAAGMASGSAPARWTFRSNGPAAW